MWLRAEAPHAGAEGHRAKGARDAQQPGGRRRVTSMASGELIRSIFFTPKDFTRCSNSSRFFVVLFLLPNILRLGIKILDYT